MLSFPFAFNMQQQHRVSKRITNALYVDIADGLYIDRKLWIAHDAHKCRFVHSKPASQVEKFSRALCDFLKINLHIACTTAGENHCFVRYKNPGYKLPLVR